MSKQYIGIIEWNDGKVEYAFQKESSNGASPIAIGDLKKEIMPIVEEFRAMVGVKRCVVRKLQLPKPEDLL